ncbi:MAG: MFS transporter [Kofleriaceae bacterium]|nr:MFS transporter [Kofleriaceae bacterium]
MSTEQPGGDHPYTWKVHPYTWFVLNLPFGATSGFVSVMLGFILHKQGMSDAVVASLVALNLLPHTWKVFWAPIADSTMTRKRWYILANVTSCLTILGLAFVPITKGNLGIIEWLVFLNSLAITFVGMSVEGLMAHATPPDQRGRAAGMFQAGNVGGAGFGGGLGLYLAENISTQVAFIVIAAVLFACQFALRLVPEAPKLAIAKEAHSDGTAAMPRGLRHAFGRFLEVFKELWSMVYSRRGVVALILCFLPIGSAAAQGIFSGQIATDWGASAELVATTSGLAAGVAATFGCIFGGWLSDKAGRRLAYMIGGAILAVIAIGMAVSPKNPTTYGIFNLAYQAGGGIAYGTFTGFVLDVIGKGAAATKYNMLASLSNIPILYMTKVDGWLSTAYGPVKMLFGDAGSEIAGILVFLLVLVIVRPGKEKLPIEEAAAEPAPLPEAKAV